MLSALRLLIVAGFVCCTTSVLYAQLLGQFMEASQSVYVPFTITNYGTRHGLPQNQVIDIVSKKDGELILITANGIVAFDGSSFHRFATDKTYLQFLHRTIFYDQQSDQVYGVQLDGTIELIAPTFKTLFVTRAVNQTPNGLIGCDPKGAIWEYDFRSKKKRVLRKTRVTNSRCILRDHENIYFSDWDYLYCFNTRRNTLKTIANASFSALRKNKYNGRIYGITEKELHRVSEQGCTPVSLSATAPATVFTDLEFTPDGEFFVTSNTGLFYHHPAYNEQFGKSAFLPTPFLESLLYNEQENCLFMGSTNKGLFKLNIKNCSSLIDYSTTAASALNSVVIGQDKSVYISSTDNFVYRLSMEGSQPYIDLNPLLVASCSVIADDVFVGTWGRGIQLYKGNQFVREIATPYLPNNYVFGVFRDSQGTYWVGTSDGAAYGKKVDAIRPFPNKRVTNRIICFYERRNGDICLGGAEGLFILDKNYRLKAHYDAKSKIVCKEIRSFLEDKEGKLWIATYNGGLYCLENNRVSSINARPNCLLSQEVFTLARNHNGDIYMTSNVGLWMVNEQKLNDFYRGKIDYLVPFYYGNESGILNTEFNGGFLNNYARTAHDHFYFPSIEGLVAVYPEILTFRKIRPKIKNVFVDGKAHNPDKRMLPRQTRSVEFVYYTPNYLTKYNVHYQFRLSGPGIQPGWGQMQKNGVIRFEYLPPGDYELTVRAIDGFNHSHPVKVNYRFSVASYWYETWWAIAASILLFLFIVVFIVRNQVRKQRRKQLHENAVNNTLLELKLKAIQAKMNPHFIFNTLNNIQYLIILGKNSEAEQALNRFSQLLRKFLQQSDHSFVRLSEEITLLELYIAIEQYRFEGELQVEINIPRNCENRIIPTLMLQPVIENAIKHGLTHSNGEKHLVINAQLIGENMEIRIRDNGIGRNRAEAINLSRKSYISHGWRLVEEKIRMVYDKYGIEIAYAITDNHVPDSGTTVVFTISKIDDQLLNS